MRLIQIGKLGKPHGFRGAFVAITDTGRESALGSLGRLFIGADAASAKPFPISEASWMPRGWKVKLDGIESDATVKSLTGQLLFAEREALPEIPEGEFYVGDLVGAAVVDAATGERIGTFVGLEASGDQPSALGHDRWWIDIAGERRAIPATKRFVESVDVASRTIRVKNLSELG